MLVDGDLLGRVVCLSSKVAVIVEQSLVLGIELEALVLKVVPLFKNGFQLKRESVIDELILNGGFKLFEELDEFVDLDLVALHELLLVPNHGALEALVHALSGFLNAHQQVLYHSLRLTHRIERHFHFYNIFLLKRYLPSQSTSTHPILRNTVP